MALSSVNNMISLQESQLIHMLEQGPARARVEDNAENRRAWMAEPSIFPSAPSNPVTVCLAA